MTGLTWGLEFSHPIWLLAFAVLPSLWWYFRHSLVDFAKWQRAISLGVRSVITLLLVLVLAGLTLLKPTARQFVVVAVDQSLSVGNDELPKAKPSSADRFVDELLAAKIIGLEDRIAFVPFGTKPGAVSRERPLGVTLDEQARGGESVEGTGARSVRLAEREGYVDGTDIAAAIEAAAAVMPPDYVPRILLLTDGNQTHGDALQAALATKIAPLKKNNKLKLAIRSF